jgi:hypothetical protein
MNIVQKNNKLASDYIKKWTNAWCIGGWGHVQVNKSMFNEWVMEE